MCCSRNPNGSLQNEVWWHLSRAFDWCLCDLGANSAGIIRDVRKIEPHGCLLLCHGDNLESPGRGGQVGGRCALPLPRAHSVRERLSRRK